MRPSLAVLALALAYLLAPGAHAAPTQTPPCPGGQSFDDGSAEWYLPAFYDGPVSHCFLSRFTPPSLPYGYDRACLYLIDFRLTDQFFDLIVCDDDGPAGRPRTVLRETRVSTTLASPQWLQVDFDGVRVTSGSLWV